MLPNAIAFEWLGAVVYSTVAYLMDIAVLPGAIGGSLIAEEVTASPIHFGIVVGLTTLWCLYARKACVKFASSGADLPEEDK